MYANTPALRHALADAFRHAGKPTPAWLARGTASTAVPVTIDERLYVLASVSDPENPTQQLAVLYDPDKGWLTADYLDADGVLTILGDVISPLPGVVASYRDKNSNLSKSISDPTSPLPIKVEPGEL
jgi:hypothetical protein